MKLHSSKMKSYLLFVFGCLIFAEQVTANSTDISTDSPTNISSTIVSSSTSNSSITVSPTVPSSSTVNPTTVNPTTENPTTENPPEVKNPNTGSWTVYSTHDNVTCIKLDAAIQFRITYERNTERRNVTAKLNVPKNATVQNDTCEEKKISLMFDSNVFNITFKNESNKVSATTFSLDYVMDTHDFPDAVDQNINSTVYAYNKTEFEVPLGKSYLCKIETLINLEKNVVLSMQEVRVEALMKNNDNKFSDAVECSGDDKIYDIVPIAVGCALAILVIIVLIAYLVGRQRSRQQGYQSV